LQIPAQRPQGAGVGIQNRCAVEDNASGRRRNQAGNGGPRRGLAASAFADKTEGFAPAYVQIDAVDRVHMADRL